MTFNLKTYRNMVLITFALLVFSVATTQTALAKGCSVNCIRVYSMEMTDLDTAVQGIVKLVDETGGNVRGTLVHAVWTLPDGTTLEQRATIGTRMRATLRISTGGGSGIYTLTIVDAVLDGYTFDPINSKFVTKKISVRTTANQPPTAVFNVDNISGSAPLTVNFDSTGSTDPDGIITSYTWDFGDVDNSTVDNPNSSTEANPIHTYTNIGNYTPTLTVTDNEGAKATQSATITVTDINAGCIIDCMSVDNIALSYKAKSKTIEGFVSLLDENNGTVKNAVVHAVWTLPDASTVDQYSDTRNKSGATFNLKASVSGTYTLTTVEVIKPGYAFDPTNSNVLDGMINILP